MGAQALNFNYFSPDLKPRGKGAFSNGLVNGVVIHLSRQAANPANQELPAVRRVRVGTTDIGIEAFDAVHQTQLNQEFQRPVYRRRGGVVTLRLQLIEQIIRPDWSMTGPHQFQHPATKFGQSSATRRTQGLRHIQRAFDAAPVVVPRFFENFCLAHCLAHLP